MNCSPTLGTFVSTKTNCIKLIFIGKITLVPIAFLMALSIFHLFIRHEFISKESQLVGFLFFIK